MQSRALYLVQAGLGVIFLRLDLCWNDLSFQQNGLERLPKTGPALGWQSVFNAHAISQD